MDPAWGDSAVDHYEVVLFLPPDASWRVAEVRRRLPPGAGRISDPHVVVKSGLRPKGDVTALEQVIAANCAATQPFTATATRFHVERVGERLRVRLELAPSPGLSDLHERLVTDAGYFGRSPEDAPGAFRPAIAVVEDVEADPDVVRAAVRDIDARFAMQFDAGSLICVRPSGDWITVDTYSFEADEA